MSIKYKQTQRNRDIKHNPNRERKQKKLNKLKKRERDLFSKNRLFSDSCFSLFSY